MNISRSVIAQGRQATTLTKLMKIQCISIKRHNEISVHRGNDVAMI